MNAPQHDPLDTALRALAARQPADAGFTARVVAALPAAAGAQAHRTNSRVLLLACTAASVSAVASLAGPDLARVAAEGAATLAHAARLALPIALASLAWGTALGLRHWIASRN